MKFDFIIGNPPYQEDAIGDNKNFAPPVYYRFMDEVYCIGDKVELIHPARFLFNAGATPKEWNRKMLNDPHFKVVYYEPKSGNVFSGPDIKGGVAITYRNNSIDYGELETFTAFNELNSILNKVKPFLNEVGSIEKIIFLQNKFNLDVLNEAIPDLNRTDKRLESSIFELSVFTKERIFEDDYKILGLIKNKRVFRYINKKFIDTSYAGNLFKYKVMLPKSNGSGTLGEVLSTPLIGQPLIGYTRSFMGIGAFNSLDEAEAALKYIKSKFARVMLGVLKITQDNPPKTWKYVPLQDFTEKSDIDWSQSIAGIDRQLYKKYGLDEKEITFIETHVKEMS